MPGTYDGYRKWNYGVKPDPVDTEETAELFSWRQWNTIRLHHNRSRAKGHRVLGGRIRPTTYLWVAEERIALEMEEADDEGAEGQAPQEAQELAPGTWGSDALPQGREEAGG